MYLFVFTLSLLFVARSRCELSGRYTREIKSYEIVIPHKVSGKGEFVSYYLPHFYNVARVRRGADSGKVHYVVPIQGANRVLELLPSEDFHAPGMVIEHHENDARLNVGSVKFRRPRKLNCYYHGWVQDEPSSSAAITACSGLAGSINIGSDHYLIEPVKDDGKPTEGPKHVHILYKREHQKGLHNRSICGTKETFATAFEERMKWEEKYGKETEKAMMGGDDLHSELIYPQNQRSKKWCTTCKPKTYLKCQSPYPPCQIERPLFLELAIVIGPRVAIDKYLFEDMEQYINTIINVAVKNFQDSSLDRPILVKLVRVITLGHLYEDLDPFRYDAEELLKRFCEWQTHFNPKREVHPNHHDFILYLVKFGDCSGEMQGLTNMASVCRPDKACGVVSLEGLLTGHVITHMIGHSLGADHDDENVSGCKPVEPDGTCYHMAQHICTSSTTWSICSRQCISKFTSTHAAWCMSDVPTAHDITDPTLLPGQVYSAAEQCRINFEMDTYACLVGEFCKNLFCKINDNECMSMGEPPAQGTRCGPDQWCFNQRCVHRGSRPGATNGEWGIWSQWTPCTKTCGGGVQTANRACDSPSPGNGGRKCPGSWLKSRMCNVAPCPDAGKGFLDQQCKNTNSKLYHGRRHEWLYFNQQVEDLECVVMCINERNEVAVRAPLAIDGTFCKPGSKDVCIRGSCRPVGCDWVIGSKAKEDACGVCHGNGTECRVMQGYFTEQNFQGRMPFLKLPIGTSMILLRETRPSPCFFVIANSLNSTYYLNSDDAEERAFYVGAFMIQFTTGIYQLKANMERIFIKDPVRVPITISVVCRHLEPSVGILYQYALPEPNNPDAKPHYTWEFLSWEKCPHTCGGAIQRASPVCVEAQGGEVEDSYCPPDSRPIDRIRVCNPKPCKAKWWVGPWSECDCYMKDGIKTRMVMCAHMKAARSYYITLVPEEECLGEEKPISEKPCDQDAEKLFWVRKEGRKKRDYMDLVPYNKEVENYSVWDDHSEDYLTTVNVRDLLQKMDPESVEDYAYLKKIGISAAFWDKLHDEQLSPNERVRRRKAIIPPGKIKSKSNKEKDSEKITESSITENIERTKEPTDRKHKHQNKAKNESLKGALEKDNNEQKKEEATHKKPKDVSHMVISVKEKNAPTKGPARQTTLYLVKDQTEKKATHQKPDEKGTKGKSEPSMKPPLNHSNYDKMDRAVQVIPPKNVNLGTKTTTGKPRVESGNKKGPITLKEVPPKKKVGPTVVNHREKLASTKEAVQHKSVEEKKNLKAHVTRDESEQITTKNIQKTENEELETSQELSQKKLGVSRSPKIYTTDESSVDDSYDETTKKLRVEVTDVAMERNEQVGPRETTEKISDADFKKQQFILMTGSAKPDSTTISLHSTTADEQQTHNEPGRSINTSPTSKTTPLTVPEMRVAPGLTPFIMYATETPSPGGKCWRMVVKTHRTHTTCQPKEEAVLQPAEDAPEWDFVNTSNVKIYVVPIQTTIRTIIQNDNEFVLMETLAKYPVADENSKVEHTGDAARRKLKIAKEQQAIKKTRIQE